MKLAKTEKEKKKHWWENKIYNNINQNTRVINYRLKLVIIYFKGHTHEDTKMKEHSFNCIL